MLLWLSWQFCAEHGELNCPVMKLAQAPMSSFAEYFMHLYKRGIVDPHSIQRALSPCFAVSAHQSLVRREAEGRQADTQIRTYTDTQIRTHTDTQICTYTDTQIRTYTHTQIHKYNK